VSVTKVSATVKCFFLKHPGGSEILLENSGVDSTVAFDDVGHSTDARELLKDYLIGDLAKVTVYPIGIVSIKVDQSL
jgi:cytochrome b involved in lipid metabolism